VAGQPPADEAVLETVPPGATRSVALFAKLPGAGHHPVTARVPNDRLAADDERVMVVAARQRFDVLLVEGQPARAAQERAAFFLQQALQPVARAAAAGFFVQVGTVTLAELDAARLEEFDAVVLADAPGLPARAALEQYLRRGGGVVVFPGPGTRPEAYHQEWRELLPARLGAVRAAPPEQWFGLQPPPYEHPVVTLWNDPAAGTLESARFYRAYELTPADGARVVARFADGAPALVERAWGAGRVVLAASTANTAWNDLPVRPAFVPLLFRTLGWLGREQTSGLNVRVGENFVHRARDEQAGANVTVEPPATGAAARGLSRVEVVEGVPVAQFDRTDWSGTYRVRIESEPAAELAFAAQADPAESDLTPLSAAQEQALATVAELGVPDTVEAETVAAGPARGEWWWPVVLAALALAVTETVLGHWFSRAK